jgi:hypothetical protein
MTEDLDEEMYCIESPMRPEEILEAACDKRRAKLTLAEIAEAIANAGDEKLGEVLSLYREDEHLLLGSTVADIIDDYLKRVVRFERGES